MGFYLLNKFIFGIIVAISSIVVVLGPRLCVAAVAEATSGFQRPISQSYSLGYGFLDGPINYGCAGGEVYHPGVDLNVAGTSCDNDRGTDIHAVADGVVRDTGTAAGEWGTIVIEHNYKGTTYYSQYGHLDSILVNPGDTVDKDQHIGEMGDKETGCVHLHFEIRKSNHPNPTHAPAFCSILGGTQKSQVASWYEDPISFVQNHPSYSGGGGTDQPDLVIDSLTINTIGGGATQTLNLLPNQVFHIDVYVKNKGDGDVSNSFKVKYLLSSDKAITKTDSSLGTLDSISSLDSGDIKHEEITINAPSTPGTYYIGAWADSETDIGEDDNDNNFSDSSDEIGTIIVSEAPISPQTPVAAILAIINNLILANDYLVTSSVADGNGSVSCTPTIVSDGASSTCTIAANSGYHLSALTDNGAGVLASVTGDKYILNNVTANHAISATFAVNFFTVTEIVTGGNGSIGCISPISLGGSSVCTITPNAGYHLATLTDNGANVLSSVSGGKYALSNVITSHTVSATFAANTYTVTGAASSGNGIISCATPIILGSASICIISPNAGYYLTAVADNGANVLTSVNSGKYTVNNVTTNHTITAAFALASKARIGPTGYDSLGAAYAGAPLTAIILALDSQMPDMSLTLNQGKHITIKGGYKSDYSGRSGLPTLLKGALHISNGKLTVDRLVVR